ncbi:flavin-containing monooxygenase [Nocardioides kongjuensis]|uniref:4-hydroxyacetophenone monooxygenase n=1 Tax=Nocardioides kongjuensis TaxID=349522 RepID=A0A852RQ55_9ACTN|nr:NAD(P)/FAD-dependent oxidoreductase [Nocardioides kongjuensis]NYD32829.1 4-hydroxyacetophenone monooxygenase [Nocardioides kongjuensis]
MTSTIPSFPTIEEIRARAASTEVPALLMTVAHVTGDVSVLRDEWRPDPALLPASGLAPEIADAARAHALDRLEAALAEDRPVSVEPPAGVLEAIGRWSLGETADGIDDLIEAAFVPDGVDPRAPRWTLEELAPGRTFDVAIVGTGISGLLSALRMKQAGIPFTIYEKGHEVGGTWSENTYPDCRTDVHSHIYTYSFHPHDWPSYFCRQSVILDYLRGFAEKNGLLEHIRFGTAVAAAAWDEDSHTWSVTTVDEEQRETTTSYSVLISAVGQLNRPSIPAIEGLEKFAGPAFHSAEWDHSVDLAGKRVAVIGTGASALQFAPAVAKIAEQVTIVQRSAPWLMPTPELRRDIGADERWLLACLPLYRAYYRLSIFLPRVIGQLSAVTVDLDYPPTERAVSAENEQLRRVLTDYLLQQAGERTDLAEAIVPDYPPGSKRIVRDDGTWVATLKRDNVRLVTGGVTRADETGIWTSGGEHVEADVILFGTGFKASEYLMPMRITGRDGRDLHELWGIDAAAYMGITIPGFPNLFCAYGPNTNLVVHGNLVFFLECQAAYVVDAIRMLLEGGHRSMDLRADVFEAYQDEIAEQSALRAWGWSKTHSWYHNAEGRSTVMWPLPAQRYLHGTAAAQPELYDIA